MRFKCADSEERKDGQFALTPEHQEWI